MKTALLLAGRGRRLGKLTERKSKTLIELLGKPLLGHLLDRLLYNGLKDIIGVVGYRSDEIVQYVDRNYGRDLKFTAIINSEFENTNNLYSLWLTRELLAGKDFIVCNGDLVLNKFIMKRLISSKDPSAIMIDDTPRTSPIDSPGTIVKDGRIFDLGRHIPFDKNGGYAIGLYKYGSEMSSSFFTEATRMLEEKNMNAGFHDPLLKIFDRQRVAGVSTGGLLWTDIDVPEDIGFAEQMLRQILVEEEKIRQ